ncbi:MAG: hypothetical protein WC474_12070 [Hydrogenophilaceae bacterium]
MGGLITGAKPGLFCVPGRGATIPEAIALILRIACLPFFLFCSIANVAALDLSLPKELVGDGQLLPMPRQGAIMGAQNRREGHSPAVSLYTDNVKQTIKRRLRDSFPRDSAGRVICGEASYAMTLRPDGSIDRLEVVPIRPHVEPSSNLESYFVQPTPGYRNAGSAKYSRPVATEKEELQAFAQRISELLRGIAPYAAQPELESMPDGQNGLQSQVPLVLVSGNIGVECHMWKAGP